MPRLGFLGKIIDKEGAKVFGQATKAKGSAALDELIDDAARVGSTKIGRATRATARGAGKVFTGIGASRPAMGALAIGALALGAGSKVGPAVRDASLGAAFGDENADTYFTGRKLDSRFLAGSMMGGVGGKILRATAPEDSLATNYSIAGNAGTLMGTSAFTGAVGGVAGGTIGSVVGGVVGGAFSMPRIGKVAGGAIGGLSGLALGGSLPSSALIGGQIASNQEFYKQSPYSGSAATASQLNASGNIVLGMHNSRRGY